MNSVVLLIIGVYSILITSMSTSSESCNKYSRDMNIFIPPKPISNSNFTLYEALNCGNQNYSQHAFQMKPGVCYDLKDFNNHVAYLNSSDRVILYDDSGCTIRERHLDLEDACFRLMMDCVPCGAFDGKTSSVKLDKSNPYTYVWKNILRNLFS